MICLQRDEFFQYSTDENTEVALVAGLIPGRVVSWCESFTILMVDFPTLPKNKPCFLARREFWQARWGDQPVVA